MGSTPILLDTNRLVAATHFHFVLIEIHREFQCNDENEDNFVFLASDQSSVYRSSQQPVSHSRIHTDTRIVLYEFE